MTEHVAPTPEGRVQQIVDLLDLERIEDNIWLGKRQPGGEGRVFGGQVVAQALMAAMRTVDPARVAHSLHGYFMRGGNDLEPIGYQVERDFDGGSFSTRRVVAIQNYRPIFSLTASFHKLEPGFHHQEAMPDVPPPEALLSEVERVTRECAPELAARINRFQAMRPVDTRWVNPRSFENPVATDPVAYVWNKLHAPIGDDANLHRAILSYISDMALLGTCTLPHAINWMSPGFTDASLDHAVWIHDDFRVDDWLLYAMDSPWSGRARGFNRGRFYTRDGRLVASVAQEGLMRVRPFPPAAG